MMIDKQIMKAVIILFLCVFSISCSIQPQKETKSSFQLFIEKIPTLKLPIDFNSNKSIDYSKVELDNDSILNNIIPREAGFILFGKVLENSKFCVLVGLVANDQGSPYLISVDSKGKKIDTFLAYKTCGFDMGYYSSNFVEIENDYKINFTDSILTREINEEGSDEIAGTEKIEVKRRLFIINEEGKFIEKK